MNAPDAVTYHRCGAETGEDPAEVGENVTYCEPCRGELVLPCDDCGGTYGPTVASKFGGAAVKWCPDCGRVCAYWDDSDLCERDEVPA